MTAMTEDTYAWAIRNELDSLAFDVHRILHAAHATDPDEIGQTLDYIQRKVEQTRTVIADLPRPAATT